MKADCKMKDIVRSWGLNGNLEEAKGIWKRDIKKKTNKKKTRDKEGKDWKKTYIKEKRKN